MILFMVIMFHMFVGETIKSFYSGDVPFIFYDITIWANMF